MLNACVEKRDIGCISPDNREGLLVSHKRIENCHVLNTQKSIASISSDNQQNHITRICNKERGAITLYKPDQPLRKACS